MLSSSNKICLLVLALEKIVIYKKVRSVRNFKLREVIGDEEVAWRHSMEKISTLLGSTSIVAECVRLHAPVVGVCLRLGLRSWDTITSINW